jgi:BirA family transcriptional regulator, biotin operon repressor / biotin---[acetyl-CoA-carboxylase] ligase
MTEHAPAPSAIPTIVRLPAVDSTQAIVFALAADGAADGTTVVADYQREGRGRAGRLWHAPPGTALLASVLIRPSLTPRELPLYSFAAAIATAETIERVGGIAARLKWPNDVLVSGKKIAGILLEAKTTPPRDAVIAIGVGVNVSQTSFPSPLDERATSLAIESTRTITIDDTLTTLLDRLASWRARLERDGFTPIRTRWLALAETIGRRVEIEGVGGVAIDLAEDGALVIDDGGVRRRVVAGEIDAARR